MAPKPPVLLSERLVVFDATTEEQCLAATASPVKGSQTGVARPDLSRAQEAWQDMGLVATSTGTPPDPSNLRRAFSAMTTKAGLGHWHPHELRRSAGSILSAAGVRIEVVSDIMGHVASGPPGRCTATRSLRSSTLPLCQWRSCLANPRTLAEKFGCQPPPLNHPQVVSEERNPRSPVVGRRGLEPLTPCASCKCATNCANGPVPETVAPSRVGAGPWSSTRVPRPATLFNLKQNWS